MSVEVTSEWFKFDRGDDRMLRHNADSGGEYWFVYMVRKSSAVRCSGLHIFFFRIYFIDRENPIFFLTIIVTILFT